MIYILYYFFKSTNSFGFYLILACPILILMFFFIFIEEFYLSVPENYHYLSQSGCVEDKTISDQESFREVIVSYFLIFPLLRVITPLKNLKKKSDISVPVSKRCF